MMNSLHSFKVIPLAATAIFATVQHSAASFHFYDIQEVYSNASGSVQFIELFSANNGQQFLSGHSLVVRDSANAAVSTFLFPSNGPSPTGGSTLLLATVGFAALYPTVTPDFTLSENFLRSLAGDYLDFSAVDSVNLASLPLDGVQSLNAVINGDLPTTFSINANATPTNFAGNSVTIVPDPKIIDIAVDGSGNVILTLNGSEAGWTVQRSDGLTGFVDVASTPGTNTLTIDAAVVDPNADGIDFYRVRN